MRRGEKIKNEEKIRWREEERRCCQELSEGHVVCVSLSFSPSLLLSLFSLTLMMTGKCDVNEGQVRIRKVTRKRERERNLKILKALSGEKKGRRNFGEQVYQEREREREREKYQREERSIKERERERGIRERICDEKKRRRIFERYVLHSLIVNLWDGRRNVTSFPLKKLREREREKLNRERERESSDGEDGESNEVEE